jgi:hypothetical protein
MRIVRDERRSRHYDSYGPRQDTTSGGARATTGVVIKLLDKGSMLSDRDLQLAEKLVLGETTGRVARSFRISAARVSQLRRELCANWHRFVGELADAAPLSIATA